MPLFILTETSAGYALLKAKDKKLLERENFGSEIATAEQICSELRLKQFQKFDSAAEALEEVTALVESKVTPRLASLLESLKDEKKASLAVADPKLGTAINKLPQLSITPISDSTTMDLYRAVRDHLPSLIPGLLPNDISTMSLGLSHSLSRHKLRFSPDKIDTMIVQAVALLDDLDKELNTYAMRVKEWYGWHFPEMAKIVNDNIAYARIIIAMGMRSNAANTDLSEILPEEIEGAVKAAAEVSMGTEITKEDLDHIKSLAEQVVGFTEYRQTLSSYLASRMAALAPNLTALVGDLVGARLISHAGSLLNLAKSPSSTIQILGAEKALFRALKTKHDTPKYGLIYHASLVGQATGKNKGKIARVLAAKAALGLRADAYANWGVEGSESTDAVPEEEKAALGIAARSKIERRLAGLEGKPLRAKGVGIAPAAQQQQPNKWEIKEARKYNPDADGLAGTEPAAAAAPSESIRPAKPEKKIAVRPAPEDVDMHDGDEDDEDGEDGEDEQKEAIAQIEAELNGDSSSTAKGTVVSPELLADDQRSIALSSVSADTPDSPDSPTQQELNWQSSITGNTKVAKKARKKERHERRLELSTDKSQKRREKNDKIERRLDRKERRLAKEEQDLRRQERDNEKFAVDAAKAGLSITRYKRKLERGEIKWVDGEPVSISKKDIKKPKKAADQDAKDDEKKRKREDDEGKLEKKKKKQEKKEKKERGTA